MPDPRSQGPDETRTISLADDVIPEVTVRVRRNPRARHVRLHVDESGVVTASVPKRFAAERIDPIVRERTDWLREVLTRMHLAARATEVDLDRGDPVRLLGRWVPTVLLPAPGTRSTCREVDGRVELRVADGEDPYAVLERWYRSEARRILCERVEAWANYLSLSVGNVSIRDQRTRWGSCTHRGDLSFNWRLLLAPPWVLDAIVVHELCHIDELNHSDRFWALLDERYPRHREAQQWLTEHGAALRVTRPMPAMGAIEHLKPTRRRPARAVAETIPLF